MTNSKNSSNNSSESNELYAIAETSGQQFWFEVDRYYDIDRLNAKEKDKITLEKVLVLKDKDSITIGKPYVKDAKIELEVVSHRRDKKIIVYCRSGNRSGTATKILNENGFKALNMLGGMNVWKGKVVNQESEGNLND